MGYPLPSYTREGRPRIPPRERFSDYSLSRIKARNRKTEILWIFFGIHTANAVMMIDKIRDRAGKADDMILQTKPEEVIRLLQEERHILADKSM